MYRRMQRNCPTTLLIKSKKMSLSHAIYLEHVSVRS